jgi:hypothetical protein
VTAPEFPPGPFPPLPQSGPPLPQSGPPFPQSPAPVAAPPAARPRRGLGLLALGVAALSLLVAVVASVVAVRAGNDAAEAQELARALREERGPAPIVPTEAPPPPAEPAPADGPASPATDPTDPNATGEPRLDERTTYEVKYQREPLTVSSECNYSMYIDVDEPRADVPSTGWDVAFNGGCGVADPPTLRLGEGVAGTIAGSRLSTPADCAEKIRQAPIGADVSVPARQGVVLCINTSYAAARERGDQWRIARLEVISAEDGKARIEAYAWNVT